MFLVMMASGRFSFLQLILLLLHILPYLPPIKGIGINWGMQSSHPLSPREGIRLIEESGFTRIKFFEPEHAILEELTSHPQLRVIVGVTNSDLESIEEDRGGRSFANSWVRRNILPYVHRGANITHIAVGNEPDLREDPTQPPPRVYSRIMTGLQNIHTALRSNNLTSIRLTIPFSGSVLSQNSTTPHNAAFDESLLPLMREIARFLSEHDGSFSVNIYPFYAIVGDSHYPFEWAFEYNNVRGAIYPSGFQATYDMVVRALTNIGHGGMPVMVGETGWPTRGHPNATIANAAHYNTFLIRFLKSERGTPMRPNRDLPVFFFALTDENNKRENPWAQYWGVAYQNGTHKYRLGIRDQHQNTEG